MKKKDRYLLYAISVIIMTFVCMFLSIYCYDITVEDLPELEQEPNHWGYFVLAIVSFIFTVIMGVLLTIASIPTIANANETSESSNYLADAIEEIHEW